MRPSGTPIKLRFEASASTNVPAEQMDSAVRQLQDDLRQLPIVELRGVGSRVRAGSKAAEALTLGAFLLTIGVELVKQTVPIILEWLRGDSTRTIKIVGTKKGPTYKVDGTWKSKDLAEVMALLAKQESRRKK